jgi:predicted nucleotidyltransferase
VDGEINEGSDIDLLIIGNFKESFFERILVVLRFTELPIEPLVYTQDEFHEMRKNGNPFILEILKKGKKI